MRVSRYFTLYFIPLFPTAKLGEYVRCGACGGQFPEVILTCTREEIRRAVQPWVCPRCSNRNPRSRNQCLACGAILAPPPPLSRLRPPPVPSTPATRPPPVPVSSGTRNPDRARAIVLTVVAAIVALLVSPFIVGFISVLLRPSRGLDSPTPRNALYRATSHIGPRGQTASGNSAAAVALAKKMAATMVFIHNRGFTQSESKSLLDRNDTFKVYCDLRPEQCVFLIHVPELRRFEADAQRSLGNYAWRAAEELLEHSQGTNRPIRLAIGIRGNISYDRVLMGDYTPALDESARPGPGVQEGFGCEQHLIAWFTPMPTNTLPVVQTDTPQPVP